MEVVIVNHRADVGCIAADAIERVVKTQATPTIGLATGSSPLPIYAELIERHQAGRLSFSSAVMFLLDEYVSLAADHPQSYLTFIRQHFTDHVDVRADQVHGLDGCATDLVAACRSYEALIAQHGGIDLQILGIGQDGHIGFNEPSSSLGSRTRLKTLKPQTRSDNARFFESPAEVPSHVLTQGIATILEARHLILVATGAEKAEPVALMVEGPVTAMVPASALQFHPHATVIADEAAAAQLSNADYYRDAYKNKPHWQAI